MYYIQCHLKVFRPLGLFPHFVTLQPHSQMYQMHFSLVNLHTIPHNDKAKKNGLPFADFKMQNQEKRTVWKANAYCSKEKTNLSNQYNFLL